MEIAEVVGAMWCIANGVVILSPRVSKSHIARRAPSLVQMPYVFFRSNW